MRLIDSDRLCEDLLTRWEIADKQKEKLIIAVLADVVTPIIAGQPTVVQPEIIRCKDCIHNGSFDTDCPINWNGKEYCSFAERRTEND